MDELIAIRQVFAKLTSGLILEIELGRELPGRLEAMRGLLLRTVTQRHSKVLELDHMNIEGPSFSWCNTREDWLDCVEKVDALMEGNSPGHQYLTNEGIDDALVELCYQE